MRGKIFRGYLRDIQESGGYMEVIATGTITTFERVHGWERFRGILAKYRQMEFDQQDALHC